MHASVCNPSQFMEQEPQIPSRQDLEESRDQENQPSKWESRIIIIFYVEQGI